MSITPEYNTFSFGITPWVGGAPEKPLGLVGDTGARGRRAQAADLSREEEAPEDGCLVRSALLQPRQGNGAFRCGFAKTD